jgi:hypothetical protein
LDTLSGGMVGEMGWETDFAEKWLFVFEKMIYLVVILLIPLFTLCSNHVQYSGYLEGYQPNS